MNISQNKVPPRSQMLGLNQTPRIGSKKPTLSPRRVWELLNHQARNGPGFRELDLLALQYSKGWGFSLAYLSKI